MNICEEQLMDRP